MALYLLTLGYDEKFLIRFLLRHKISNDDHILIIAPNDFDINIKSKNAFESIKKIVFAWMPEENLSVFTIDPNGDLVENIIRLKGHLNQYKKNKFYVSLSGGMRIIIVITLICLIKLSSKVPIQLEIDFENLENYKEIPLDALFIPYSDRLLMILKIINNSPGLSARRISREVNLSPSTISREIKKLRMLGFISIKPGGLEITKAGKHYLRIYSN